MRIIWLEIRRIYARQAVRFILIAAVVGALATGGWFFFTTDSRTKDTDAIGRVLRRNIDEQFKFCMRAPFKGLGAPPEAPPEVQERILKQQEYVPSRRECMQRVNEAYEFPTYGKFLFFPLALAKSIRWMPFGGFFIALFIGISFVGADWSSGWTKTFLTWESRRIRAVLSKAAAIVLGLAGLYIAGLVLITAGLALTSLVHGSFRGFDAVVLEDVLESGWRGLFLTGLGGLIGFSLTLAARYTLVAPIVIALYLIVEGIARAVNQSLRSWSLSTSVMIAGTGYDVDFVDPMPIDRAVFLPAVVALVGILIATATFARRDVTG